MKFSLPILLLLTICTTANSQEFNARVTVAASQVSSAVNKNTFTTLQSAINNFLNNRKWTNDVFTPNERINCNMFLNLEESTEPNVYNAQLTIQVARPVLNASYNSPIINFKDDNITFKYVEFQQLEFNENRVSGTDPLVSNLTAVFAYYANLILGIDYNSFQLNSGQPYFLKAQAIVNNAPDGRGISGWKSFDGQRNRYWLITDILNPRYTVFNEIYYTYYRNGLDKMYNDINTGRAAVLETLNHLDRFNEENRNTMINQFFFLGKANELANIFSKAPQQDKIRARSILTKIDISNANTYEQELK